MKNQLTQEEKDLMPVFRDKWIDFGTKNNDFDLDKFTVGINEIYSWIGKPNPRIVVFDSPMGVQIGLNIFKSEYLRDSVGASVGASVWASVEASVRASVGASVRASVWASVEASVRASVRASVGASVRASVGASVWASVEASVGASVWASVEASVGAFVRDSVRDSTRVSVRDSVKQSSLKYEPFTSYGNISDYGWVAFYDYFQEIGVDLGPAKEKFNKFKDFLLSGHYDMCVYENTVFVSKKPHTIIKNQADQLHNVNGPAMVFNDGYELYFINGRNISSEDFYKIKNQEYTFEDFAKQENEEKKSAAIAMMQELYGDAYLFRFFDSVLKEIDTYVDEKDEKYLEGTTRGMNIGVYTLFKGETNDVEFAYVRCYCPSTDRMFYLGVDSIHTTAKDAIASLYRVPKMLKPYIKSISRQGERFATIFDGDGKKILKSMTKDQISDVTSVSGNEYFLLIKYEY